MTCARCSAAHQGVPLLQGNVPFHLHEVSHNDLYLQKPQWLLDLNPFGTVPFLAWQQTDSSSSLAEPTPAISSNSKQSDAVVVTESLVINEYLEEAYQEYPVSIDVPDLQTSRDT